MAAADLVGLAAAVGVFELDVEAEGEPVTRGVLELETEDVVVLEICPVLEGDGWAVGERETAAECVGVCRGLDVRRGLSVYRSDTDTDAEVVADIAGLADVDWQGDEDVEAAADIDTEFGALLLGVAAAVAVRLGVVEAVIESWAVWVAVSVGFTVDV